MPSPLSTLTEHLGLPNEAATLAVVEAFESYVRRFLHHHHRHHRDVLDPDLRQIRLRLVLAAAHPSAVWRWGRRADPGDGAEWLQSEHATAFVHRLLVSGGRGGGGDKAVREMHRRLCLLQSVWLENGVWVEDEVVQSKLKRALVSVMAELAASGRVGP